MSLIDELVDQLARIPTERQIQLQLPSIPENTDTPNMALPQIHVKDYLELIPAFDGNPTKLSRFLEACEEVFPLMAPGNEPTRIAFTMLHIKSKLVGKAASLTAARRYTTFPELKAILINLFGDQRNEESLLADLNILRQKTNETPHQFADRCIDIRSLLLAKLSCQEIPRMVQDMKIYMYNNFTLRAFITGVNSQLSHLLRCRDPKSIEEAIQIVTDEENLNYHRAKIGITTHNKPTMPTANKQTPFQLRINPPQTRQTTTFTPQQKWTPTPPQQQKWTPKPLSNKQPFFQQQHHGQQAQSSAMPHQRTYQPSPMEVDSNRTRLTRQSVRPNQPKYKTEELTTQEVEPPEYEQYDYSEEPEYSEYENYEYSEEQETEQENFRIPASDTRNANQ